MADWFSLMLLTMLKLQACVMVAVILSLVPSKHFVLDPYEPIADHV